VPADFEATARTRYAAAELEVGPVKQTLTFDAERGEYFYQCDAHSTMMEGIGGR
jgi:hypothetical protein